MATTMPTAKQQFLRAQDTRWADKYGGTVPYYPQQRYFDKGLAPEHMPRMQIEALADAAQTARRNGLMSDKQIERMFPTLLIENATGTHNFGYPVNAHNDRLLQKAGAYEHFDSSGDMYKPARHDTGVIDSGVGYINNRDGSRDMMAMMAKKTELYGPELALERWNGQGTAKGGHANASNHARKVRELEELLKDPKNAAAVEAWNMYSHRHANGDPGRVVEAPDDYQPPAEPGVVRQAQDAVRRYTSGAGGPSIGDQLGSWGKHLSDAIRDYVRSK